jgi:NAD(P)-dependent dehydrogenase (short-subunit alcohol dehydrogenase family)
MAATRELDGRVALVTGGGQGIGRAVAARLLADGAQVITTGRKPEPAEPLDGAVYVQADQSIDADWARVMAVIHDRFDRLDICVVNGGVAGGIPIREMTLEQFRALNSVNLKGWAPSSAWWACPTTPTTRRPRMGFGSWRRRRRWSSGPRTSG